MILETPLASPTQRIGIRLDPRPTRSDIPKRSKLRRWLCKHDWLELYKEEIMFFQEHVGDAYHSACVKCGETKVDER